MVEPVTPETAAAERVYKLDRALLDKHGQSYIETICLSAGTLRTEGRDAEANAAMRQCERLCAILMSSDDLLAEYRQAGEQMADADLAEVKRRGLLG